MAALLAVAVTADAAMETESIDSVNVYEDDGAEDGRWGGAAMETESIDSVNSVRAALAEQEGECRNGDRVDRLGEPGVPERIRPSMRAAMETESIDSVNPCG